MKDTLIDEFEWVLHIRAEVWELLSSAAGVSPMLLRSRVVVAAHTSVAFITDRVLSEAKKPPWSLAEGDIKANRSELRKAPVPDEPTTAKIWNLLQMQYSEGDLIAALELMRDCGWSTTSVEQQHGSASIIHKFHSTYGQETLMMRSMAHMLRQFCNDSEEDQQRLLYEKRLKALEAKRPSHLGGRQLYFKDCMQVARMWKERGTRRLPANVQTYMMKMASASYKEIPLEQKQKYAASAAFHRESSAAALAEDIDHARAAIRLHYQRATEAARTRKHMVLSQCRFTKQDNKELQNMLGGADFGPQRVKALRASAAEALPPPSSLEQARLSSFAVGRKPQPSRPWWLASVCLKQELFAGSALLFCQGTRMDVFLFVFAKQSPYLAYFSPMCEVEEPTLNPMNVDLATWEALALDTWRYRFTVDYRILLRHDELNSEGVTDVRVLPSLVLPEGQSAVSDAAVCSIQKFLGEEPAAQVSNPPPTQNRRMPSGGMDPDLLKEHPWLAQVLSPPKSTTTLGPGSSGDKRPISEPASDDEDPCDDDAAIEAVFSELRQVREAWADKHSTAGLDFKWAILGGNWTKQKKIVLYDAFQGKAVGGDAQRWCKKYGMNTSSRYARSVFGDQKAAAMSRF